MKQHEKLELNMVLESLANTLVESGITAEDVNTATVKLSGYLKSQDILNEQDQPGFFSRVGDFLGGLSARAGFRNALSPHQLEQQKKAVLQSLKNYMNSLSNAHINNAVPIFSSMMRQVNALHQQAIKARGFGGPGIPQATPVPAPSGKKPAAPGATQYSNNQIDKVKGLMYGNPDAFFDQKNFEKDANAAKQEFLRYKDDKFHNSPDYHNTVKLFLQHWGYKGVIPEGFHSFYEKLLKESQEF